LERCKRDAAQPRVEEHAKRALEPWESGSEKELALQGRSRLLFRPCRAFIFFFLTQGFGRCAAFTLGFAAPRFQRWFFVS
jgi:hypothetical protein